MKQLVNGWQHERYVSILVVEQNVSLALKHATFGYVMESGRIVEHGEAHGLMDREHLSQRYLGSQAPAAP
jgi:branched-chain amino acid transport system ATP-binding protein